MEDLLKKVNNGVSLMDYDWYKKKKSVFAQVRYYNPKEDLIHFECSYDFPEVLNGAPGELPKYEDKFEVEIDLYDYCWDSEIPELVHYFNEKVDEYIELPYDGKKITDAIVTQLIEYTISFTDVTIIYKCLIEVIEEAKKAILVLKNDDSEYNGAQSFFLGMFQKTVFDKFDHIRKQIEISETFSDKLEFNLTQEQLVGLLYILNKSEFLNTLDYNDTTFLAFCQQYFRFKFKGIYRRPKSSKTLYNKYNEFKNNDNPKGLDEIMKRLEATITTIKKGD